MFQPSVGVVDIVEPGFSWDDLLEVLERIARALEGPEPGDGQELGPSAYLTKMRCDDCGDYFYTGIQSVSAKCCPYCWSDNLYICQEW